MKSRTISTGLEPSEHSFSISYSMLQSGRKVTVLSDNGKTDTQRMGPGPVMEQTLGQAVIDELMLGICVAGTGHLLTLMHMEGAKIGFAVDETHPGIDARTCAHTFHIVFQILELGRFCESAELHLETVGKHHTVGASIVFGTNDVVDVDRIVFTLVHQLDATKYGRIRWDSTCRV